MTAAGRRVRGTNDLLRDGGVVDEGLRWELLGPVRAWRAEVEINLGPPQQRAILAVLLLREGSLASTEQLISAVWGDSPPSAAVGMVRSYISRLRRVLDDGSRGPVIESIAGGYALATQAVDLAVFERRIKAGRSAGRSGDARTEAAELRAALALWKGNPLAGVRGEVTDNERTRLIELRYALIEDLAAVDLQLGRHHEAESELRQLVTEQPLRERARELLMLALYRAGRKAEALELFQLTRRLLADELGLDPGPELQEMQRRILASDPSLAGSSTDLLTAAGQGWSDRLVESPMQLPPDVPTFVARADEGQQLTWRYQASEVHVPVIGLTGPPGGGKTTLAIHLGHRWREEFPGGQYFIDLATSTDALSALLRALGVTELPPSAGERAALWRSLTIGRPQVVHAIGARLASRPEWSLAATARKLRSHGPNIEWGFEECRLIAEVYQAAIDDLDPMQAWALRLLAVPRGPALSLAAAAAALDLPSDQTESLLESLADVHLVETVGERYSFLRPIGEFARAAALRAEGEAACDAALLRLSRFYLASLSNAMIATGPVPEAQAPSTGIVFTSPEFARVWMVDEQVNLWESAAQTTSIRDSPTDLLVELIGQAALGEPLPTSAQHR